MNATIKDVAKAAGVSVATVSRVLNNSAKVSATAIALVNEAIKELNYSPNFLGRNLRKCETNVILVIMPTAEQAFYSTIISGMQSAAVSLGYDIIASISNSVSDFEARQMNMLFNRTVDAAVLLGTQYDADTLNELAKNYCIALCCEATPGANVLTVTVDDEQAGYDATKVLIDKGHREIAIVSTTGTAQSSVQREQGYRRALEESGIPINDDYIYKNTYDYRNGSFAVSKFMSLEKPPTAIFAISDLLAAGVIKKATKLGYKVGVDLDVIGFDNIKMCEMMMPSISTVAQPCIDMGKTVIEKLVENINSRTQDNNHYKIPHQLVLRQSTGDK